MYLTDPCSLNENKRSIILDIAQFTKSFESIQKQSFNNQGQF